ncbi:MAG: YitT family protein [Clostridia bacterium]|nr:YitT family protein [Clostridia bacterium]
MKKPFLKILKKILLTAVGCAITAFAVATFLTPNKIVLGGATGIATILYHTFGIPQGISFAAVNAFLLLISVRVLGKEFAISTVMGAGFISVFVQVFSYLPPLTDNIILATLFGGVLYGLGIGIAFSVESSTGGMDILGRLIQHRFRHFPVGKILQGINGVIIAVSYFAFRDTELILFSVLSLFVSTFTVDWFISRLNVSKIAFVITDKGEELSKFLVSSSPRGVTMMEAVGAYSFENKEMLFCALKNSEIPEFQKKVLRVDEKAFIVYADSPEIKGNGFHLYR